MSAEKKKILVTDDDVDTCTLLSKFLTRNGYDVEEAHSGKRALEILRNTKIDLMLCDFRLGDYEGTEMLSEVRKNSPATSVIIITGYSDIKIAVNVIKSGAFDYLSKPLIPDEILHIVKKALEVASKVESKKNVLTKPLAEIKTEEDGYIAGVSEEAKELNKQIMLVAPTNFSVIIYGESGAGKEAVAHSIHNHSRRKDMPFVALDCGAISKELAGSELFGHEKGSFTGAIAAKTGHFEMANGGTLFLDEVYNLPFDVQTALLRVLQEKKARRIGGTKEIPLDVRIIVASNENLLDAHRKGKFREDLFHRFNEFNLVVSALRDRKKDIMIFAEHFLKMVNKELDKSMTGFSQEVIDCFMKYSWPGNIRELKNVVKRAALLSEGNIIQMQTLPVEISNPDKFTFHDSSPENKKDAIGLNSLKDAAHEAEYNTILKALRQVNFNKTKAAKILNIDRKTLYNKMKSFNLLREDDSQEN